ncbi:MAG TPA: hypothetical protein PKH77_19880 [Anaerolineae bacterium]|nr:hypothetical protein [Anaerolineae bacterium]
MSDINSRANGAADGGDGMNATAVNSIVTALVAAIERVLLDWDWDLLIPARLFLAAPESEDTAAEARVAVGICVDLITRLQTTLTGTGRQPTLWPETQAVVQLARTLPTLDLDVRRKLERIEWSITVLSAYQTRRQPAELSRSAQPQR